MDDALKQLLTLGRAYYEKKQYAQAQGYLEQVVEQSQSFADVYNMLGVIYHDQGQFSRAERAFEAALQLNPAYTEASLNLAVIYNDLGKYLEAKEVYQAALRREQSAPGPLDPFVQGKVANMYADIGNVYAAAGLWGEAIAEFRRALTLCPQYIDIRLKLATACRDGGDPQQALFQLDEILKTHPHYLPARIQLGLALFTLGRKDEAVHTWEQVLASDPGNRSATMYLGLVKDVSKAPGQG